MGRERACPPAPRRGQRGRATLQRIIEARVDARHSLIEPAALQAMLDRCGGVLRDLFYLLREAALEAMLSSRESIAVEHVPAAAHLLRSDYANRLSPPARGTPPISYEDLRKALGAAGDWPRRDADKTPAFKLLLQTLCVLEYNGETWHDLHPLIREHLLVKEAAEAKRQQRLEAALTPGA